MHDAHLEHAAPAALVEIVLDHADGVAGRERVQVELSGDGKDEGIGLRPLVVTTGHRGAPPAVAAAAAK